MQVEDRSAAVRCLRGSKSGSSSISANEDEAAATALGASALIALSAYQSHRDQGSGNERPRCLPATLRYLVTRLQTKRGGFRHESKDIFVRRIEYSLRHFG